MYYLITALTLILVLILLPSSIPAHNQMLYPAEVVRVIDGDSLIVWIEWRKDLKEKHPIRLYGIDAPEPHACPHISEAARDMLVLRAGNNIRIELMGRDGFRRLLARIYDRRGRDIGQMLLDAGLARIYPAAKNWCE